MQGNNQHDPRTDSDSNIIRIPSLEEREKLRREKEPPRPPKPPSEPMINLPPVTKTLILLLVGIHLAVHFALPLDWQARVIEWFSFVPAYYNGSLPFSPGTVAGPLTYALLHGGWMHLIINTVMLMAFGTGVERWMGGRQMLVFAILCSLAAAAVHLAFNWGSYTPMVGASGAISGLFAAAMVMLSRQGRLRTGRSLMPLIVIWILISVVFGMMGTPDGQDVAWAAHVGGFLAGLVLLYPYIRRTR